MAANAARMEYAKKKMYGNLAYQYGAAAIPAPYEQPYTRPKEQPREKPAADPRTRAQARPQVRAEAAPRISALAVGGAVCIIGLLFLVLMCYLQMTVISAETVRLEQKLENLQEDGVRLQIDYEKTFDLRQVEEIATTRLGMVKMNSNQIIYVDGAAEDEAIIYKNDGFSEFFTGIRAFIGSLLG